MECSRRDGEVLALFQKALELGPNFPAHMIVSIHYFGRGQLQEAIASAENAVRLAPALTMFQAYLGYVYGMTGRREEARRILEGLERRLVSEYVSPVDQGMLYWSLGEEEKAMDLLERGFEEGDFRLVLLKASPWFDPLRSNPRFQDLLRRMNFPD
jgi:tetratricopeptide (TPR) repeat protein